MCALRLVCVVLLTLLAILIPTCHFGNVLFLV